MPTAPPKACSQQPCPKPAVYRGRCEDHARLQHKERGTRQERGYDSTWLKLRKQKLAANPFCEIKTHCKGMMPDNIAVEVDHIITIRERPDLRLTWSNLQSACHACHSAKTWAEYH